LFKHLRTAGLATATVVALAAAPARAATTTAVGIGAKPHVVSWGTHYYFVHQGQALTVIGSIRPAEVGTLTLQYSANGGNPWVTQLGRTTDAAGNTTAVFKPSATRYYRWVGYDISGRPISAAARPTVFPSLRTYPNCAGLNAHYAHGVGRPNASDRGSAPVRNFLPSTAEYNLVAPRLDRDRDGIACERR
jgi:hypothetical protein